MRGAASGASARKPQETKTMSISFLELQTFDTARLDQVQNRVQNNENPLSAGKSSKIRTSVQMAMLDPQGKGVCGISIVEVTKYHRTSSNTTRTSSNTT
jgi:hypothetical protein